MVPGATQFARTPAVSWEIALVSAITPAFAAAYAPFLAIPVSVAGPYAATLTIRPSEGIRRTAARQQRNVVRRLTAIIFSNVATEVSATSPPVQVPAVWTAPQSGPNFATAASYALSTCASSVTSATARSMPNTFAPSRSSRAETTVPRFPEAPVTTTQRPLSMPPPISLTARADARRTLAAMHVRARPTLVYGALIAQTFFSAGTYLFGKRALTEIPALPLGMIRFAGASLLLAMLLLRLKPPGQRLPPRQARR